MSFEPRIDLCEHCGGHLGLAARKVVIEAPLAEPRRLSDAREARTLEAVLAKDLGQRREYFLPIGEVPSHRRSYSPSSLSPGWPSGRRPSGQ